MKKLLTALLALSLVLCLAACACAEGEKRIPACGNPEHYEGDGLDHSRPPICWVYGH